MRTIATLLGLTTALAAPASTQSVVVVQPLAFGVVMAGVASTVPFTDPVKAARVMLVGGANQRVRLLFTLPANLTGPGAPMPLVFGPGSAGYATVNNPAAAAPFNPRNPANRRLSNPGGQGWVFLGGTVLPPAGQTPGVYSNVVILTVLFL